MLCIEIDKIHAAEHGDYSEECPAIAIAAVRAATIRCAEFLTALRDLPEVEEELEEAKRELSFLDQRYYRIELDSESDEEIQDAACELSAQQSFVYGLESRRDDLQAEIDYFGLKVDLRRIDGYLYGRVEIASDFELLFARDIAFMNVVTEDHGDYYGVVPDFAAINRGLVEYFEQFAE